ncbi:M-phase phosphoprotein 6-like [Saccoglossus kowalevskii]|uniref:M-phase phosphoprotein 6-like n=1 Tax=Saccoglossus kowalevskii TaxID=10224 RepID=A0ABM0M268_SACKO|nr:PREDICTED: M-phase phosphoprotein 6-like [Saccoglossus kowalevskii]
MAAGMGEGVHSERESGRAHLSKHLMQMKFMQRRQDNENKVEFEESQQRRIDETHWVIDVPELTAKQNRYSLEPSHIACECLKFGRMSFKGFNPAIEKIMKTYDTEQELELAEEREKEIAVSDDEMAKRYDSLIGTVGKKFVKKRHRSSADNEVEAKKSKLGFLKPSDD